MCGHGSGGCCCLYLVMRKSGVEFGRQKENEKCTRNEERNVVRNE